MNKVWRLTNVVQVTELKKKCPRCGERKHRSLFGKNRRRKDGLQSWCKQCRRDHRNDLLQDVDLWEKNKAAARAHRAKLRADPKKNEQLKAENREYQARQRALHRMWLLNE